MWSGFNTRMCMPWISFIYKFKFPKRQILTNETYYIVYMNRSSHLVKILTKWYLYSETFRRELLVMRSSENQSLLLQGSKRKWGWPLHQAREVNLKLNKCAFLITNSTVNVYFQLFVVQFWCLWYHKTKLCFLLLNSWRQFGVI